MKKYHYAAIVFNIIGLVLAGQDFELGNYYQAISCALLNAILYFFNLENHKNL